MKIERVHAHVPIFSDIDIKHIENLSKTANELSQYRFMHEIFNLILPRQYDKLARLVVASLNISIKFFRL